MMSVSYRVGLIVLWYTGGCQMFFTNSTREHRQLNGSMSLVL